MSLFPILPTPAVSTIAHTIELSVAPVFLLAGLGQLLNLFASRLARVVDRARELEAAFTQPDHPAHFRQVRELRVLDRRMRVINAALGLCVLSAILVCLVVAGLFVANLLHIAFGRVVAGLFVLAMLLLILGLCLFLFEVRLALQAILIRDELLERVNERRQRRDERQA